METRRKKVNKTYENKSKGKNFDYFNYYIKDGNTMKASKQNLRKGKKEKEIVN